MAVAWKSVKKWFRVYMSPPCAQKIPFKSKTQIPAFCKGRAGFSPAFTHSVCVPLEFFGRPGNCWTKTTYYLLYRKIWVWPLRSNARCSQILLRSRAWEHRSAVIGPTPPQCRSHTRLGLWQCFSCCGWVVRALISQPCDSGSRLARGNIFFNLHAVVFLFYCCAICPNLD